MISELNFLSEISTLISDALWSEPELSKKEKLLSAVQKKIGQRILSLLPPDTPLIG